jgi:hypothetical protein
MPSIDFWFAMSGKAKSHALPMHIKKTSSEAQSFSQESPKSYGICLAGEI